MTTCAEKHHSNHLHQHGQNCGHIAIRHDGHVDYLHDSHLHHAHEDHVDEHVIATDSTNLPRAARPKSAAHTCTVLIADTKRYRTATTSIIL